MVTLSYLTFLFYFSILCQMVPKAINDRMTLAFIVLDRFHRRNIKNKISSDQWLLLIGFLFLFFTILGHFSFFNALRSPKCEILQLSILLFVTNSPVYCNDFAPDSLSSFEVVRVVISNPSLVGDDDEVSAQRSGSVRFQRRGRDC